MGCTSVASRSITVGTMRDFTNHPSGEYRTEVPEARWQNPEQRPRGDGKEFAHAPDKASLGVKRSGRTHSHRLPPPYAHGYHQFDGAALLDVTVMNHTVADAAGAITSTTSDLVEFWRALLGGRLLGPTELAQMQDTVPVNDEGRIRPGSRYGLGIIWYPTSCGGGYWHHQGDTLGFSDFNAVNDDGTRVVVVSQTTTPGGPGVDPEDFQLLDDVMCAGR